MACANARASGGADPLTTRGGTRLCMLDDDVINHIIQRLCDGALVVALTCTRLRDAVHKHSGTHRIESNASHVCVPEDPPPSERLCVRHPHLVRHASPWLCLRPPVSPQAVTSLGRLLWALDMGCDTASICEAAAAQGQMEVLAYAHASGWTWGDTCARAAATAASAGCAPPRCHP